ncbi:hypothetical protein HDU91_005227 [Kappamyces sp. JEL0680]|nr:hypothetical protein HDU91_005227 [Kappamyces sp. JEL0680]
MGRQKDDTTGYHFGKSDLDRIGMFSEPNYISSGEVYTAKKGVNSLDYRANGKQFLTAPLRKGHDTKDGYFEKNYTRLFENEPYVDLVKLRRGWRLQAKEKNIVPVPFKPSSVPSRPYVAAVVLIL